MKNLTVLFFFLCTASLQAQDNRTSTEKPTRKTDYKNAIGIRAGTTAGATFKHFFNPGHAAELILGIWPNAFGFTALYEKHEPTGIEALRFYYGGGAHVTAEAGHYVYRTHRFRDDNYHYRYGDRGLAIGVDGIAGIEYKIPVVPLALSLDIKPFVEISNFGRAYVALDGSLGIKIAL